MNRRNARVKVWCLTAWRHPNIGAPYGGHTGYYTMGNSVLQSFFAEFPGFFIRKAPGFHLALVLALPIFPASYPASIVGANELNFCVRDGNRWTLTAINTNSVRWLCTTSMSKAFASNGLLILAPFCLFVNPSFPLPDQSPAQRV